MGIEYKDPVTGKTTFIFPRGKENPMAEVKTDESQTKTYANHTITLNPNWEFSVSGPEFDQAKYSMMFKSFSDARSEIDRRVTDAQKLAARDIKFSLCIINENGETKLIEKISRQNSDISNVGTTYFYPDVDWIREALGRQTKLRQEITDIDTALRQFRMSRSIGYGRMDVESYARKVESLKREINEKTTQAQAFKKLESVETPVPQSVA